MKSREYAERLGMLLMNLQALEFVLRVYLHDLPGAAKVGPPGYDAFDMPVGGELPETALTNYDTLGQLIGKFNAEMDRSGLPSIDPSLVAVRDALAHGRVSSSDPAEPMRLLKFDKPQNGRVRVTFNEELNAAWFALQARRLCEAINSVGSHLEGFEHCEE